MFKLLSFWTIFYIRVKNITKSFSAKNCRKIWFLRPNFVNFIFNFFRFKKFIFNYFYVKKF